MLSLDTTKAVTGYLLDVHTHAKGWRGDALLLAVLDYPDHPAGPRRRRRMRVVALTAQPAEIDAHPYGLAGLLTDLAGHLTDPPAPATGATRRLGATLPADLAAAIGTRARLLAWAVRYDSIAATDPAELAAVRRVDAVDIDGRVYQLTRRLGTDDPAVALIDDQPDPHDIPATGPGLAALVAATGRLTHTGKVRP